MAEGFFNVLQEALTSLTFPNNIIFGVIIAMIFITLSMLYKASKTVKPKTTPPLRSEVNKIEYNPPIKQKNKLRTRPLTAVEKVKLANKPDYYRPPSEFQVFIKDGVVSYRKKKKS